MDEALICKLEMECVLDILMGIRITRGTKSINHSQFPDDTLLIGGASLTISNKFKRILDTLMDTSRGGVNKGKCHIYDWHTNLQVLYHIPRTLQFLLVEEWSFFHYLGIHISIKGPSSQAK
jgi:hypothetical protein